MLLTFLISIHSCADSSSPHCWQTPGRLTWFNNSSFHASHFKHLLCQQWCKYASYGAGSSNIKPGWKVWLFTWQVNDRLADTVAFACHCFIAQVLKTPVKPAKRSAPCIPHMLASCCYLHVMHAFVCVCVFGCARENKCLCVRFREPPLGANMSGLAVADKLSGKGPSLCANDGLSVRLTRFSWLRAFTRFSSPLIYFTSSTPFILYSSEGER